MNDDAFEKKLESLAGALPRPDPTPQWKVEILARARREAGAAATTTTAATRRVLPPRWLMTVWCAAWALMALMHFTTPDESATERFSSPPWVASAPEPGKPGAEPRAAPESFTLLAFHREMNLSYNANTP